ncbi:MAG: hypothetical protein AAB737_02860 [Patescibacteria group bacterium]
METIKSRPYHLPRAASEPDEVFEPGERVIEVKTGRVYTIKTRSPLNFYFVEELEEGFFVSKQLRRADS